MMSGMLFVWCLLNRIMLSGMVFFQFLEICGYWVVDIVKWELGCVVGCFDLGVQLLFFQLIRFVGVLLVRFFYYMLLLGWSVMLVKIVLFYRVLIVVMLVDLLVFGVMLKKLVLGLMVYRWLFLLGWIQVMLLLRVLIFQLGIVGCSIVRFVLLQVDGNVVVMWYVLFCGLIMWMSSMCLVSQFLLWVIIEVMCSVKYFLVRIVLLLQFELQEQILSVLGKCMMYLLLLYGYLMLG